MNSSDTVLVIGACGQIGSELTLALRQIYKNVIATDLKEPEGELKESGQFERLDVLNRNQLAELIQKNNVTQVYHLAAILSATGEKNPELAWRVNMKGLRNVLDVASEVGIKKLFWPSTIAVFGPTTPMKNTPQWTVMEPNTIYGISKQAGERWCDYYWQKKSGCAQCSLSGFNQLQTWVAAARLIMRLIFISKRRRKESTLVFLLLKPDCQ